ncbi:MAG: hypothetical protein LBU42_09530 [Prevotellaceae bacterium]|jgi:hypothetical protein|nr:hypothetical protein [Prevotellaceae bacterium]
MKQSIFFFIFSLLAASLAAQGNEGTPEKSPAGYYNLTQLSLIIGETDELSPAPNLVPSITTVNGYRFNEHFAMGAGVGMAAYRYVTFPVFLDLRGYILKGDFTPLLAFKGGYAFADNDKEIFPAGTYAEATYKNTGGWMLHPEIGFRAAINASCNFVFTIGYYYQDLKTEVTEKPTSYRRYPIIHTTDTHLDRLCFTIGFLF